MSKLAEALRGKFKTPKDAVRALGLDDSILAADNNPFPEIAIMAKEKLNRVGVYLRGALTAALLPKLAKDAAIDLGPVLTAITAKNFKDQKPILAASLKKITDGKLAKDASLEDVTALLDNLEKAGADELDPNSAPPQMAGEEDGDPDDAMDAGGLSDQVKAFLATKLSPEDLAKLETMCSGGSADAEPEETEEDKRKREEAEKAAKDAAAVAKPKEPDMVSKKAMDEALKATAEATEKRIMDRAQAIADAKDAVEPYVGKIKVAMDSAEKVYSTALTMLGEDGLDDLPLKALQRILASKPKLGSEGLRETTIAQDAAAGDTEGFFKRFPGAERIGLGT